MTMKPILFAQFRYLRRAIIACCAAIGFLGISPTTSDVLNPIFGDSALYAQTNPIVVENSKPGTTDWKLTNLANDTNLKIKGYASDTSVSIGGSIDIYVTITSTTAMTYTMDVFRMGYYGGLGGRQVTPRIGPLNGIEQAPVTIDMDPAHPTGLIQANWIQPHTLNIDCSWTSGVYLIKLENADGKQNYVKFVVRNDGIPNDGICDTEDHTADFLYHHADTTDQAYNRFPADGVTGKSFYGGWGGLTVVGSQRAVKVSFDRPYENDGSGLFFQWEYPLVRWLEKEGYDVTYASDMDTHRSGTGTNNYLRQYKAVLSAGHDEYFSRTMFDNFVDARDNGVNLFFFGSNAAYWHTRFEDNDRTLVVYKNSSIDPETDPTKKSIKFRQIGLPEQELIGVQYETYNSVSGPDDSIMTDYIVQNSEHWAYSFTGFEDGDKVTKIVGYEVDTDFGSPPPAVAGTYQFLASSPFTGTSSAGPVYSTAHSSYYESTSGARVFATGTLGWAFALEDGTRAVAGDYIDERIQITTRNVLDTYASDLLPGDCGHTTAGSNGFFTLEQEAELGNGMGDFVIGTDANASSGQYAYVPSGPPTFPNPHRVDYCFTVTEAGLYRVSGRVYAEDTTQDSFWVQVNGLPANGEKWSLPPQFNTYVDTTLSTYEFVLQPGDHIVSVYLREPNARLDKIGLDLRLTPPGQVSLIAPTGTIATTTPTFEWQGDLLATEYWLVVYNETTGQIVHNQPGITPADAACAGGGTCSYAPAITLVTGDAYRWLLKASNSAGAAQWSTGP